MRVSSFLAITGLILLLLIGCSTSSDNPVDPGPAEPQVGSTSNQHGSTNLWGFYDFIIDPENETVEIKPGRSIQWTVNVTGFLNNSAGLSIENFSFYQDDFEIDIDMDLTITHPMSDEKFNGYDVRGVFISEGSESLDYDPNITFSDQITEPRLNSPDGYTRWFNPSEFINPGIFGYIKGNLVLGSYTGTATLNPYIYFAEGIGTLDYASDYLDLSVDNSGAFLAGSQNTRYYSLVFPKPPGLKYNYAIIANWGGASPIYHPAHAHEPIALRITSHSTMFYINETSKGGNLTLDLDVYDWESIYAPGPTEDFQIIIESSVLSSPYTLSPTEMTPANGTSQYSTYMVDIPADNVTSTYAKDLWVIIEEVSEDYSNEFGIENDAQSETLTSYFRYEPFISDTNPYWVWVTQPNGGNIWLVGNSEEITWDTSGGFTEVDIMLSLDSGSTFPMTIASATENDGSYMWDPIPPEAASPNARIKIAKSDDASVMDVSDSDFTVENTVVGIITVLKPNGGELWSGGGVNEITWVGSGFTGAVTLEYSNDDFNSDINLISAGEANDGSYVWNIPCIDEDITIRITSDDFPTVFDTSDFVFSVLERGWARTWDSSILEIGTSVAADVSGNSYVTGYKEVSPNDFQAYIRKIDTCGEAVWEVEWGGPDYDRPEDIVFDNTGFAYVCGYFADTTDFDPGPGTDDHTSNGDMDCFLVKYDADGNFQWAQTWGGTMNDRASAASLDFISRVFVTGYYNGTADLDPSLAVDNHTSNGSSDIFLSTFQTSGAYLGGKTWGGTGVDRANDVHVENLLNVYVTGFFSDTVDFDPGGGTVAKISNGLGDVFISKFNSLAAFDGVVVFGGSDSDSGVSVNSDPFNQNVYVVGNYAGTVDFNTGGSVDLHISNGGTDGFISGFDSAGTWQWTSTWGGTGTDMVYGSSTDGAGSTAITGYFEGTVDFDPGLPEIEYTSEGSTDVFISMFNSSGDLLWATTFGTTTDDEGRAVYTDSSQRTYATGYVQDFDCDFTPKWGSCDEYPVVIPSNGNYDAYLVRYTWDGCW